MHLSTNQKNYIRSCAFIRNPEDVFSDRFNIIKAYVSFSYHQSLTDAMNIQKMDIESKIALEVLFFIFAHRQKSLSPNKSASFSE